MDITEAQLGWIMGCLLLLGLVLGYVDPQGLDNLKRIVQDAEKSLDAWPSFPQQAQPVAAGDAPQAARP